MPLAELKQLVSQFCKRMVFFVSYAAVLSHIACDVRILGLQLAAGAQQLQGQQGADVAGLPILVANPAQAPNKK